MDILAKDLKAGHSFEDGSWGTYRVDEVSIGEQYVTAKCSQGGSKRTFLFANDSTVYGVGWYR